MVCFTQAVGRIRSVFNRAHSEGRTNGMALKNHLVWAFENLKHVSRYGHPSMLILEHIEPVLIPFTWDVAGERVKDLEEFPFFVVVTNRRVFLLYDFISLFQAFSL